MLRTFSDILFGSLFQCFLVSFRHFSAGFETHSHPRRSRTSWLWHSVVLLLRNEVFTAGYWRKIISGPENGVRLGQIPGPRELGNLEGPWLVGLPRVLSRSMASSPNSKCQLHSTCGVTWGTPVRIIELTLVGVDVAWNKVYIPQFCLYLKDILNYCFLNWIIIIHFTYWPCFLATRRQGRPWRIRKNPQRANILNPI